MDTGRVLCFIRDQLTQGLKTALVTVCAVEGSSMRNPGTMMGVAEDGRFAGSLSGGCIENAVVAEARRALKEGVSRIVRFGAGSPYLDIKLPCGGGLDLHFQPLADARFVSACLGSIAARHPFSVLVEEQGLRYQSEWRPQSWNAATGTGAFGHWPAPKLLIVGHGAGVETLSALARRMDCDVRVLTPDARIAERLTDDGVSVARLDRTGQIDLLDSDPWTATVFLFHDHDWEIDLMARAFELPHFYLGAMGGRLAHTMRCKALAQRGVAEHRLDEIRAPIGVFHSSRDPQTLALSTLAEIIRVYQDTDFGADLDR